MSVDDTLEKRLSEPFPKQQLGTLSKGGTKLTYVPVAEVITRLNQTIGIGNWTCQTVSCRRDEHEPDWVVAHVRLTVTINGSMASYDGHGGQAIKRTKDGKPVDLGDEFKGAESDALKKAATRLGIGLDLARKEDSLRYEAEQDQAAANVTAPAAVIAEVQAGIGNLTDANKAAFRGWWKENNLPPPAQILEQHVGPVRNALQVYLTGQDEEESRLAEEERKQIEERMKAAAPGAAPTSASVPSEAAVVPNTPEKVEAMVGATFPGAEEVAGGVHA